MRRRSKNVLRPLTASCAATGAVFLVLALNGAAQESGSRRLVQLLNTQALSLADEASSTSPSIAASARGRAGAVLQQRLDALSALIEQAPAEALRLAFAPDLLSDFARTFPGARQQLESHGTWEGPIEYIVADSPDFRTHRTIRTMRVGPETLSVQFAEGEPAELKNGDVLRVTGVRAGAQVAADSGTVVTAAAQGRPRPPSPPPCTTTGPQSSIVLLVTMPGALPPTNVVIPDVLDMFFDTSGTRLSLTEFWRENSYGATTAVGDIAPGPAGGWYTLDQPYTDTQHAQIRTAAIAAADADVDFSQYSRIFIIVNGMAVTQTWAGLGTIGCGPLSSADGSFNASTSWMRATSFGDNLRGAHLAIHEGGHNLGLQHSRWRDFDGEALGGPGVAGVLEEYGDSFSAMGRSFGHYAAPHKARIGWLPTQVRTISSSGVHVLEPTEVLGSVQALKVQRTATADSWLWLEYRQPVGLYDTKLAAPFVYGLAPNQIPYLAGSESRVYSGALVHYEDATTGGYSHLLDMTPRSREGGPSTLVPDDWLDPALAGTWQDPYTGLTITTANGTSGGLIVTVTYGQAACTERNPSVTITPSNPSVKRGQSVTYIVRVTNNDSSACVDKVFDLTSTLPTGWATAFSPPSIVVAAGSEVSVSMTKTVPPNANYNTYPVDVSATSGPFSGSAAASVTVKPGK